MQRSIRLSLTLTGAAALALANSPIHPVAAQEESGSAADLGVMEINLKDAVQFNWGFQGALQGAGTPNQAGIGAFLPIAVGENSVFFLDALANANFSDYDGYSSIINTDVAGTTISTSTRLGYRWLNGDRSWMYGVNAGYDSRPMNTGNADAFIRDAKSVSDRRDVFFSQIAAGLEAVSDSWNFNAYGLFPIGDTEHVLNDHYRGGALRTYGLDVGYAISPQWDASIGYYYQHGDDLTANDASGVLAQLSYEISSGLTLGVDLSYDEAFDTRVSGNIEYRFGNNNAPTTEKKAWKTPVIQSLTESIKHRDVRVHDGGKLSGEKCTGTGKSAHKKDNGNKYHCTTDKYKYRWFKT
ncbi:carbamoyl-phosphate synthase [Prochlorococcus sp. MIT 1313]|uniref:carbamoyl-phosphate synthase n=1 Tax=unclassified Prochlorococcus TaxID=2627481 RepID=UPI0039AF37C8